VTVRDRTRKPATRAQGALKPLSETQRANARANSAKEAKERHLRPKTEINWDDAIARLKKMLDDMEAE
jgi:hypothetical protein